MINTCIFLCRKIKLELKVLIVLRLDKGKVLQIGTEGNEMPGVSTVDEVAFRLRYRTCWGGRERRRHDGERHDQRQRQRKHTLCGKSFFGFCHRVKTPLSESKSVCHMDKTMPGCRSAPAWLFIWRDSQNIEKFAPYAHSSAPIASKIAIAAASTSSCRSEVGFSFSSSCAAAFAASTPEKST